MQAVVITIASTSLTSLRNHCSVGIINTAYRYNYDRLRVAFNDAFRLLLGVPRWTSASSLFVLHRVPTFAAVIRKFTFTLYDSIRNSSNSLLIAYVQSDLFYQSKLLLKWRKLLYTCMD